jgi:hypothetical protein
MENSRAWERYAWLAGVVFVVALVAESVASAVVPLNQNDSAAKIAAELYKHRDTLLVVACVSIVYAVAFLIYSGGSTECCVAIRRDSPRWRSSAACSS